MVQSNMLDVSLRFDQMLYRNARAVAPSYGNDSEIAVVL